MGKKLDIGEQLRRAIATAERAGISRYRIAKLAGTTDMQIKRVADGMNVPTLTTAERLADALGYRLELVKK